MTKKNPMHLLCCDLPMFRGAEVLREIRVKSHDVKQAGEYSTDIFVVVSSLEDAFSPPFLSHGHMSVLILTGAQTTMRTVMDHRNDARVN